MITAIVFTAGALLALRWILKRERALGYHEGQLDAGKDLARDVIGEAEQITQEAAR